MAKPKRKTGNLTTKRGREKLFLDIISILGRYTDEEKKLVAEEAEVSWVTLYNWCSSGPKATQNPYVGTLARVGRALGYDITLSKAATIPVKAKGKLRVVK